MNKLAYMNVGLAKRSKRQKQYVTVDAAKPRHSATDTATAGAASAAAAAIAASVVLTSLRYNLLYWHEKINTHDARYDLLHQTTTNDTYH